MLNIIISLFGILTMNSDLFLNLQRIQRVIWTTTSKNFDCLGKKLTRCAKLMTMLSIFYPKTTKRQIFLGRLQTTNRWSSDSILSSQVGQRSESKKIPRKSRLDLVGSICLHIRQKAILTLDGRIYSVHLKGCQSEVCKSAFCNYQTSSRFV